MRLFEIDGTEYGADVLRFHAYAIPHTPDELLAYELAGRTAGEVDYLAGQ